LATAGPFSGSALSAVLNDIAQRQGVDILGVADDDESGFTKEGDW
jgi:hypothetical protein